ncbi:UNVERIFIED_CONTAM: putative mitochondrial protein [Sesamum latifolium]|uniref:Mitochondrial protein n=1 Tax=Sesamum latifolium TaxID=2727402 RepID=A0AAW2YD46_9LAMI
MHCVSSVSLSFLLNGVIFGSLKLKRGLRQGDHLSSYLFLLCAEAFSNLIQQEEWRGNIQGVAICHNGPKDLPFIRRYEGCRAVRASYSPSGRGSFMV